VRGACDTLCSKMDMTYWQYESRCYVQPAIPACNGKRAVEPLHVRKQSNVQVGASCVYEASIW
jgi:hypothetical protein